MKLRFLRRPSRGFTISFIGWVTFGSSLRSGVASRCRKRALSPFTVTRLTGSPWKSMLNEERFAVARATIVVRAELKWFATGS